MSEPEEIDYAKKTIDQLLNGLEDSCFEHGQLIEDGSSQEDIKVPYDEATAYREELDRRIKALEDRIEALEYEVSYPEPDREA
jgi:polyhydroxyalkanoate synthesis regulator phasin